MDERQVFSMDTANLNVRIDRDVKAAAEKLFSEMGLTMTTAVNIFLRQSIHENGLPFRVTLAPSFNAATVTAIDEGRRIAYDKSAEGYRSIDDWRASLDI